MTRIVVLSTAIVLTLVAATGTSRRHAASPPAQITQLDPRRSMIITDLALLQGFTFQRVLDQEQTSILAESAHFQLSQIYRKQGRLPDADREMKLFQEMRRNRK